MRSSRILICCWMVLLLSGVTFAGILTNIPDDCSGSQYYDGSLLKCDTSSQTSPGADGDVTNVVCNPTLLYYRRGQTCMLASAAGATNSIFVDSAQAFTTCTSPAYEIKNEVCVPSLATCATTTNCVYFPSIQSSVVLDSSSALLSRYTFPSSVATTTFSYSSLNGNENTSGTTFTPSTSTRSSVVEATMLNYLGCSRSTGTKQHPKSCNSLINQCLVRGFRQSIDDCSLLSTITYTDSNTLSSKLYTSSTSGFTTTLYVLVTSQDGEYKDFRELTTDFQICGKGSNDDSAFKTFGTSFQNSCTIDASAINSNSDFFELYTLTSSGTYSKISAVVSHPSLFSGYLTVSRFYLYENSFYTNTLQIATNIDIKIDISSLQAHIDVTYKAVSTSSTDINVSYQSGLDGFWIAIKIIFAIYLFLVALWSAGRIYIWTIYNPRFDGQRRVFPNYPQKFILNVVYILFDCFGDALLFFMFFASAIVFLLPKASSSPSFVLPPQFSNTEVYYSFYACVSICFAFKIVATFILIWKQSSSQIYFLDWEPTKKYAHQEENKGPSSWRTLFVANEFNELSVYRLVSVEWTLFVMALLMSGLSWENGASNSFSASSSLATSKIQISIIYKFFIDVGLLFAIALVQIVVQHLLKIWIPFKIQDFSDFCSVSNISIFIFDEYLHGFYLHGQSPDKYAEGNSLWLMQCLGEDIGYSIFNSQPVNMGGGYPGQGGYPGNQGFNNNSMMMQRGGFGGQGGFNQGMGLNNSARGGLGSFNNFNNMGQQNNFPMRNMEPSKSQRAKRNERGLNGTNNQVFEFFLSWDLREQVDFMFMVREKSIQHLSNKRKQLEMQRKGVMQNGGELIPVQGQQTTKLQDEKAQQEEQKSMREEDANTSNKNDLTDQNYFSDLNFENGEYLFKPKMDGIFREVIRDMNQGGGQNSNVFEMEFTQRFLLHLPPPTHVDRRFNQNMFYVDRDNIFSSVMYSGYEFTLLYFLIAVYAFIDAVSESTLIAVLVTYAFDYIYKTIRQSRGQANLSSKAGIDEQFLI